MADVNAPQKNDIQAIFKRLRSIPTNKVCVGGVSREAKYFVGNRHTITSIEGVKKLLTFFVAATVPTRPRLECSLRSYWSTYSFLP